METIRGLIERRLELPSLPAVVLRLNELLTGRLPSMGEVAELVSEDPALAAGVLKLVNSPIYPFRGKIDSLPRAVTLVGVRELRNLALSASVAKLFEGYDNALLTLERFWRHSLCVALLARGLAEAAQQREPDRFFAMGLLHDIGALILYRELPDQASAAIALAASARLPLIEAERQVIGFSHAELGAELMRHWSLPESIVAAVGLHHQRPASGEHKLAQGIVYLANLLAAQIPDGDLGIRRPEGPVVSDWEQINVSHRLQPTLLAAAQEQLEATRAALLGGGANSLQYA